MSATTLSVDPNASLSSEASSTETSPRIARSQLPVFQRSVSLAVEMSLEEGKRNLAQGETTTMTTTTTTVGGDLDMSSVLRKLESVKVPTTSAGSSVNSSAQSSPKAQHKPRKMSEIQLGESQQVCAGSSFAGGNFGLEPGCLSRETSHVGQSAILRMQSVVEGRPGLRRTNTATSSGTQSPTSTDSNTSPSATPPQDLFLTQFSRSHSARRQMMDEEADDARNARGMAIPCVTPFGTPQLSRQGSYAQQSPVMRASVTNTTTISGGLTTPPVSRQSSYVSSAGFHLSQQHSSRSLRSPLHGALDVRSCDRIPVDPQSLAPMIPPDSPDLSRRGSGPNSPTKVPFNTPQPQSLSSSPPESPAYASRSGSSSFPGTAPNTPILASYPASKMTPRKIARMVTTSQKSSSSCANQTPPPTPIVSFVARRQSSPPTRSPPATDHTPPTSPAFLLSRKQPVFGSSSPPQLQHSASDSLSTTPHTTPIVTSRKQMRRMSGDQAQFLNKATTSRQRSSSLSTPPSTPVQIGLLGPQITSLMAHHTPNSTLQASVASQMAANASHNASHVQRTPPTTPMLSSLESPVCGPATAHAPPNSPQLSQIRKTAMPNRRRSISSVSQYQRQARRRAASLTHEQRPELCRSKSDEKDKSHQQAGTTSSTTTTTTTSATASKSTSPPSESTTTTTTNTAPHGRSGAMAIPGSGPRRITSPNAADRAQQFSFDDSVSVSPPSQESPPSPGVVSLSWLEKSGLHTMGDVTASLQLPSQTNHANHRRKLSEGSFRRGVERGLRTKPVQPGSPEELESPTPDTTSPTRLDRLRPTKLQLPQPQAKSNNKSATDSEATALDESKHMVGTTPMMASQEPSPAMSPSNVDTQELRQQIRTVMRQANTKSQVDHALAVQQI